MSTETSSGTAWPIEPAKHGFALAAYSNPAPEFFNPHDARALHLCNALDQFYREHVIGAEPPLTEAEVSTGAVSSPVALWVHIHLYVEHLRHWLASLDETVPTKTVHAIRELLTACPDWGISLVFPQDASQIVSDMGEMLGMISRRCERYLNNMAALRKTGDVDWARVGDETRPWSILDFNFLSMRDLHCPQKTGQQSGLRFERNGFAVTDNGMGYMTSCLDPYSSAFTLHRQDFPHLTKPVLEIGAAYGVATIAALRAGAEVVANDLSSRHLEIMEQLTPAELRGRLTTTASHFPAALRFQPESFSAILVSRMLHFLTIPQLRAAAPMLAEWLEPGGHLFVVEDSPYLGNVKPLTAIYEDRKANGDTYPGMCENIQQGFGSRGTKLPDLFHFFDPEVLARTFSSVGLEIINCRFFPRLDYPADVRLDGREGVGLIARKPAVAAGA